MADRFEIYKLGLSLNRRKDDPDWGIWDNSHDKNVAMDFTKSQAEQVKKALGEATKQEVGHE